MTSRLDTRLDALERQAPTVPEVDSILLVPGHGDPMLGAVMERQPDDTWTSRPVTQGDLCDR